MRICLLSLLIPGLVAGWVAGQPKDGDLILSVAGTSTTPPFTAYVDMSNPRALRPIFSSGVNETHSLVRMAANNTDMVLVVGRSSGNCLATVTPSGSGGHSTSASVLPGRPVGFDLDHDGTWIIATNLPSTPTWDGAMLLGLSGSRLQAFATAFWNKNGGNTVTCWNDVAIDRDPGAFPYCAFETSSSSGFTFNYLVSINRNTGISTISVPLVRGGITNIQIQLDPRSGDYIYVPNDSRLLRTGKNGLTSTIKFLTGFFGDRVRITQDNHLWVAGSMNSSPVKRGILEFDLTRNAVVTILSLPAAFTSTITGLDVYGSRPLVCTQMQSSPWTVTINVQSRNPLAAGASYILAASPARRPGMKFANGEWLDLDVTDPLFFLTAGNLAPQVFVNVRGTLDQNGNNTKPITVHIPSGLPQPGNTAIFVGGVIYKGTNIIQVTNSHWFVP